jgi:ribosomal protein L37AE/L43A
MKDLSGTASGPHHLICPFCSAGKLVIMGYGLARCDSCGLPLLGSMLETLQDVVGLPDALGAHACECGHPEMRELPDGVFHCVACGSEVIPVQAFPDVGSARLGPV